MYLLQFYSGSLSNLRSIVEGHRVIMGLSGHDWESYANETPSLESPTPRSTRKSYLQAGSFASYTPGLHIRDNFISLCLSLSLSLSFIVLSLYYMHIWKGSYRSRRTFAEMMKIL